jgi:biotin carboxyl carrier protein
MKNLVVSIGGKSFNIEVEHSPVVDQNFRVFVDGQPITVTTPSGRLNVDDVDWMIIGGRPYEILLDREYRWIKTNRGYFAIDVHSNGELAESASARARTTDGRIKAPIPGLVTQVFVSEGDRVEAGQALMILEAMKMENEIRTPHPGRIKTLNVASGQSVKLDEILIEVEPSNV